MKLKGIQSMILIIVLCVLIFYSYIYLVNTLSKENLSKEFVINKINTTYFQIITPELLNSNKYNNYVILVRVID